MRHSANLFSPSTLKHILSFIYYHRVHLGLQALQSSSFSADSLVQLFQSIPSPLLFLAGLRSLSIPTISFPFLPTLSTQLLTALTATKGEALAKGRVVLVYLSQLLTRQAVG